MVHRYCHVIYENRFEFVANSKLKNRAPNGYTCSAGIVVSTAFRLHSVSAWKKRIAEGIILVYFVYLCTILIGFFVL